MSYKNYNWEIFARDYNSPFFRNYIWVKGLFHYPKELGTSRLVCGIICKNNELEYLVDMEKWTSLHEELKAKVLEDKHFVENLIDRSHQEGQSFNDWTQKNIFEADLSSKSGQEIFDLLDKFADWQGKIYALGTAIPVLDFQGFAYVESFLNDYLRKSVGNEKYKDYYTLFTEPPANSFSQDQEEDLLNIMVRYWNFENWRKDVETKSLAELKELHPDFYKDLEAHTNKHAWVYYAYNGPESTEDDFLNFARDYLVRLEHPEKLLKDLDKKRKAIEKKKQEFYKQYHPSQREKDMLELAGKFVWGKPRRKDYQSRSYYHAKKLQSEIAKRLHLSLAQARHTPFDILRDALVNDKEVDTKVINNIIKKHIILPNDDGSLEIFYGDAADKFDKNIERPKEENLSHISELKGVTACSGQAKGKVKIINDVPDMAKMEYGDILVSVSTTPNIVAAMKRAAAIVTDEGGLTCHAAIVSREMNISCIIGTKIATKVFKDGDMVEVNADNGIIKKLN